MLYLFMIKLGGIKSYSFVRLNSEQMEALKAKGSSETAGGAQNAECRSIVPSIYYTYRITYFIGMDT